MLRFLLVLLLGCADPLIVHTDYSATAIALEGQPIGLLSDIVGAEVQGHFEWDGYTIDAAGESVERGEFLHRANGDFEMAINGVTVKGSGRPTVRTENFPIGDVFSFNDGEDPILDGERIMTLDGAERVDLRVEIEMSDPDGAVFDEDDIPLAWPMGPSYEHTFWLRDDGGTVWFRLLTVD